MIYDKIELCKKHVFGGDGYSQVPSKKIYTHIHVYVYI